MIFVLLGELLDYQVSHKITLGLINCWQFRDVRSWLSLYYIHEQIRRPRWFWNYSYDYRPNQTPLFPIELARSCPENRIGHARGHAVPLRERAWGRAFCQAHYNGFTPSVFRYYTWRKWSSLDNRKHENLSYSSGAKWVKNNAQDVWCAGHVYGRRNGICGGGGYTRSGER